MMFLFVTRHWSLYHNCEKPLNLWLLIDSALFFVFRIVQFAFQYCSTSSRYVLRIFVAHILMIVNVCIYPFIWTWAIIGCYWYHKSGTCLPENMPSWLMVVWIISNFMYLLSFGYIIYTTYDLGEPEHDIQELLLRFQRYHEFALADPQEHLSLQEILELPTQLFGERDCFFLILIKLQLEYKRNLSDIDIDSECKKIQHIVMKEYALSSDQILILKNDVHALLKESYGVEEIKKGKKEFQIKEGLKQKILIRCQGLTNDVANNIIIKGTTSLAENLSTTLDFSRLVTIIEKPKKELERTVNCSICLEDLELGEAMRIIPCQHIFHIQCIDSWLVLNNTCPICRRIVPHATSPLLRESHHYGNPSDLDYPKENKC